MVFATCSFHEIPLFKIINLKKDSWLINQGTFLVDLECFSIISLVDELIKLIFNAKNSRQHPESPFLFAQQLWAD